MKVGAVAVTVVSKSVGAPDLFIRWGLKIFLALQALN